jgi:hypothetical protein
MRFSRLIGVRAYPVRHFTKAFMRRISGLLIHITKRAYSALWPTLWLANVRFADYGATWTGQQCS